MGHILNNKHWSGQAIDKEKCSLFLSNKTSSSRKRGPIQLIGFVEWICPIEYLGASLSLGYLTTQMMDGLVQKI